MKRRLSQIEREYNRGEITLEKAMQTVASYRAMLKHVDMDRFEQNLWGNFVLTRGDLQEAKQSSVYYVEEPPR